MRPTGRAGMSEANGAGVRKPRSMIRGVLSFGGMTMLSRVFGLVRDQVFNTTFGTNWMTDAFWVAFRKIGRASCRERVSSPV